MTNYNTSHKLNLNAKPIQIPFRKYPLDCASLQLVHWESNCFVHRILSVAKSRMAGAQIITDFCHRICAD
jgi:hypothetical protein